MSKRLKRACVVALVAALAIAGQPSPAPAEAGHGGLYITLDNPFNVSPWEYGGCHTGYFCAWRSTGGASGGVGFVADKWNWGASDVPGFIGGGGIDNNAESWWNNGYAGAYDDVQMYRVAGGSGTSYCVRNGISIWSGDPGGLRNAVSAHVWRNSC